MVGDPAEKALDTAIGLTNQLITLATAVVTLVLTALGLFKPLPVDVLTRLTWPLGAEFVSIIFGLLVHGSITAYLSDKKKLDIVYEKVVRLMSIGQWIFFVGGLWGLLVVVI